MDHTLRLFSLYADLLEYPTTGLSQSADQCGSLLAKYNPTASDIFSRFLSWLNQENAERVEEIYTSAFDLQGVCCPYVGHHLFGDNYKRSQFMALLNQGYRARDYSCGCELPDHVAVVLRFLARGNTDEFSLALLEEGLFPAAERMVRSFDAAGNHPYGQLLKSLSLLLQAGQPSGSVSLAGSDKEDEVHA